MQIKPIKLVHPTSLQIEGFIVLKDNWSSKSFLLFIYFRLIVDARNFTFIFKLFYSFPFIIALLHLKHYFFVLLFLLEIYFFPLNIFCFFLCIIFLVLRSSIKYSRGSKWLNRLILERECHLFFFILLHPFYYLLGKSFVVTATPWGFK